MNHSSTESSCFTSKPKTKHWKLFNYRDTSIDRSNKWIIPDPTIELHAYSNNSGRTKSFRSIISITVEHTEKVSCTKCISRQAFLTRIDRVYSHTGLILSSKRNNMAAHLFRDLILLPQTQYFSCVTCIIFMNFITSPYQIFFVSKS